MKKQNFTLRTESEVTRINLDNSKKRAVGVTFVDEERDQYEQPADLIVVQIGEPWKLLTIWR